MKISEAPLLTQEKLKEVLNYDQCTGLFSWTSYRSQDARVGDIAGSFHPSTGYIYITVYHAHYRAHRLAWLYMAGEFPKYQVDHKDHVRHNNRWKNLRVVTPGENSKNMRISPRNKSGVSGVHWHKLVNKWQVRINTEEGRLNLGFYENLTDARRVRLEANKKYGYHANHGQKV